MLREKSKWKTHKDESTNAEYRGGTVRSSEEASVMGVKPSSVPSALDVLSMTSTGPISRSRKGKTTN